MDVSEPGARTLTHGARHALVVADAQDNRAPVQQPARAPTPGLAAGNDVQWSKAPVPPAQTAKAPQVAGPPAKAVLRLAAIDQALAGVENAWHQFEAERDKHQRAQKGIPKQSTTDAQLELLAKAEAAAMLRHQKELLKLREAIKAEAEDCPVLSVRNPAIPPTRRRPGR
jgi:hypothetical protein